MIRGRRFSFSLGVIALLSACRVTCGAVPQPPPNGSSRRDPSLDEDRTSERAQWEQAVGRSSGGGRSVNISGGAVAGVAAGAVLVTGLAAALAGDGGPPPPSDERARVPR